MSIKTQLNDDIKHAMRAKDRESLTTLRLISSAVKQVEVDERIDVDDERLLVILNKLAKQRHESIAQFKQAGRSDLVEKEQAELDIIARYLPEPFTESEINQFIEQAIAETHASSLRDMGQLMAYLKPRLQGRADLAKINVLLKARLQNS